MYLINYLDACRTSLVLTILQTRCWNKNNLIENLLIRTRIEWLVWTESKDALPLTYLRHNHTCDCR